MLGRRIILHGGAPGLGLVSSDAPARFRAVVLESLVAADTEGPLASGAENTGGDARLVC